MTKSRIQYNGFTLIEIMISIAILSAGFVAILYMFPLGSKIEKNSQMMTTALEIGQAKLEEINATSFGEIVSLQEEYGAVPDFPAFKTVVLSDFYDPQTGGASTSDTGIKTITVNVFWHSSLFGDGEKNISFKTLISQK